MTHNSLLPQTTSPKSATARWPLFTLAALGLFLGSIPALTAYNPKNETASSLPKTQAEPKESRFGMSFAPVVKQVLPAVAKIYSSSHSRRSELIDPQRHLFFGDTRGHLPRSPDQQGIGSGVLVSNDGYILTNNHVVDGADSVKVQLTDGTESTAQVIGTDPKTDLAVIKISGSQFPYLNFADSDEAEVGDLVLAVGNPFGLGGTVTTGILSAKGRATLGLDYEDFLQTDAAINPGNSGGALVDAQGRLLGINTAILSRTGGNQGIGFAIPSNLAREVLRSIIKDGRVVRGQIGVRIQDLTPPLAKRLDLGLARGALIGDVIPRSAAAKAGIESGDVIVEFNGHPIADSRQLHLAVGRTESGSTVPIKLLRQGKSQSLRITVLEQSDQEDVSPKVGQNEPAPQSGTLNGVGVTDLSQTIRRQASLPNSVTGALVTDVEQNSASHLAGLRPGNVLLEINREPVKDAAGAVRMSENSTDTATLIKIWDRNGTRFLVVDETATH